MTPQLAESGETYGFETVTSMRHVSLSLAERRIRFRGRLWLQAMAAITVRLERE